MSKNKSIEMIKARAAAKVEAEAAKERESLLQKESEATTAVETNYKQEERVPETFDDLKAEFKRLFDTKDDQKDPLYSQPVQDERHNTFKEAMIFKKGSKEKEKEEPKLQFISTELLYQNHSVPELMKLFARRRALFRWFTFVQILIFLTILASQLKFQVKIIREGELDEDDDDDDDDEEEGDDNSGEETLVEEDDSWMPSIKTIKLSTDSSEFDSVTLIVCAVILLQLNRNLSSKFIRSLEGMVHRITLLHKNPKRLEIVFGLGHPQTKSYEISEIKVHGEKVFQYKPTDGSPITIPTPLISFSEDHHLTVDPKLFPYIQGDEFRLANFVGDPNIIDSLRVRK